MKSIRTWLFATICFTMLVSVFVGAGSAGTGGPLDATPDDAKKLPAKGNKHERQPEMLAYTIQLLHGDAYQAFIKQPGFGESRRVPTLDVLKREWKMPDWSSEELAKEQLPIKGAKDLSLIHRLSLSYFTYSNMEGDKDRWMNEEYKKVARREGFWEIKSLDLVGWVMHDTPKVYTSAKLPEMKDLKPTPVRDLDVFESEGLEELMTGKELYIRSKNDTIRVLGPLRAGKACVKCHADSKEGDMLGAFSYTLRAGHYQMFGRSLTNRPNVESPMPPVSPKLEP